MDNKKFRNLTPISNNKFDQLNILIDRIEFEYPKYKQELIEKDFFEYLQTTHFEIENCIDEVLVFLCTNDTHLRQRKLYYKLCRKLNIRLFEIKNELKENGLLPNEDLYLFYANVDEKLQSETLEFITNYKDIEKEFLEVIKVDYENQVILLNTNPYPRIFSGNDDKTFQLWNSFFEESKTHSFLSFVYRKMEYDQLIIVGDSEFRDWLNNNFEVHLNKTKTLRAVESPERNSLYNDRKQLILIN